MTKWLTCPSFSHMCFLKYETVWQAVASASQPHLRIYKWTPNESRGAPRVLQLFFKASLDRLGCSWKTFFHRSRGQTPLRGKKRGGRRKSSGMSGYLLTTSSTFFLSFLPRLRLHHLTSSENNGVVCSCATCDSQSVDPSKEWWKKKEKAFSPSN